MSSMSAIIALLVLLSADISRVQSQVCGSVCQSNKECLQKCEDYSKNPNRNRISPPHCGLSTFGETSNVSHPWLASLQYKSAPEGPVTHRPHFCTAVIITEEFLLTSAHCVPKEPGSYDIMVGSQNIGFEDPNAMLMSVEIFTIPGLMHKQWIKRHEGYSDLPNKGNNDLALIKTSEKMFARLDGNRFVVNPICLPELNSNPLGLAHVVGWGGIGVDKTPAIQVMTADNHLLTNEQANKVIQETRIYMGDEGAEQYFVYNITFRDFDLVSMASRPPALGLADPMAYQGDSGSPIIQFIEGRAFMFGMNHAMNRADIPLNIWARIQYYSSWIEKTMRKALWDLDMYRQFG